jgi:hypothetical protein
MQGFVQGADRQQTTLLPECLDDWVGESNSIRAVDVFVDLQLFIFGTKAGWKCGLSPAAQGSETEYREVVLHIAKELQESVSLVR